MMRKILAICLAAACVAGALFGCAVPAEEAAPVAETKPAEIAAPEEVVLTVAGGWPECRALDVVANAFTQKYPNCTITYEYLQDYYASLEKRMGGEAPVDLFFTSNIQADSPMLPYALDLNSCEGLNLSDTFDGLIENFTFREETSDPAK